MNKDTKEEQDNSRPSSLLLRVKLKVREFADDSGVDGWPGRRNGFAAALCWNCACARGWSREVRALPAVLREPAWGEFHTSWHSRPARPSISRPRFWNFAILASVPASTMMFVMTLWAWRL